MRSWQRSRLVAFYKCFTGNVLHSTRLAGYGVANSGFAMTPQPVQQARVDMVGVFFVNIAEAGYKKIRMQSE